MKTEYRALYLHNMIPVLPKTCITKGPRGTHATRVGVVVISELWCSGHASCLLDSFLHEGDQLFQFAQHGPGVSTESLPGTIGHSGVCVCILR